MSHSRCCWTMKSADGPVHLGSYWVFNLSITWREHRFLCKSECQLIFKIKLNFYKKGIKLTISTGGLITRSLYPLRFVHAHNADFAKTVVIVAKLFNACPKWCNKKIDSTVVLKISWIDSVATFSLLNSAVNEPRGILTVTEQ